MSRTAHQSIRLIAIDLDGTLLDDAKQLSAPVVRGIRHAASAGIQVVIASARPPRGVRAFYHQLGLDSLQINYNGAMIWDEPRRQTLFHHPMPGPLVLEMIRRARWLHPEVLVSIEVLDHWYTDRLDEAYLPETGRLLAPDAIGPLEPHCQGEVTKLMLLASPPVLARLQRMLSEEYRSHICTTQCEEYLLQVMHRQVNKAAALRRIAACYRVPMEQTMAIGDAPNDLEMLQAAGIAVAVENAAPGIKAAAHWIAPSNNAEGVLAALQHFGVCP